MRKRSLLKNGILALLLLTHFSFAHAQNGGIANNWFFGYNAGLSFNSGSPVSILGPLSTNEGVATISDTNGNLLFSTDGMKVYNANNLQMPNGFGLWGHISSTQSGVIVPNPANANQYYIFTAAAQAGFIGVYSGIAYSMVDMSLNSGLGDITIKNIPLIHPAAEKLTAIRHCNGTDYWVICHEWNSANFYAYQVSAAGVAAPIISTVGSVYQATGTNTGAIGYLKASPNGKKLVATITGIPNNNVELFDFNNGTGIVSNPIYIPTQGGAYGAAFSPDNTKLYVSFYSYEIMQYDISAANLPATQLSSQMYFGALQLGPDGKIYVIYVVSSGTIGVINNPNAAGLACNYIANAIPINFGSSTLGLPNFPDNLLTPANFTLGADKNICLDSVEISVEMGWNSYSWSTGETTQSIYVNQSGAYWAEVIDNCGTIWRDTINVNLFSPILELGNDTILCYGQSVTLSASLSANIYLWSNGATSPSITLDSSGIYWLEQTGFCGTERDTFHLIVSPQIFPNLNTIPIACFGGLCTLSANASGGIGNLQYSLNGGLFQNNNTFQVPAGTYHFTIQDANGCIFQTQNISLANPPALILETQQDTACFQQTTSVNIIATGGTGQKQYRVDANNYQTQHTFPLHAGNYTVYVKDVNNCVASKNIQVEEYQDIEIETVTIDSAYCEKANGAAVVRAIGDNQGFSYTWFSNPRQYGDSLKQVKKGAYHLLVKDEKGCTKEKEVVIPHIALPTAEFYSVPDKDFAYLYANEEVQFLSTSQNAYFYSWDFGDATFSAIQNPTHAFVQMGEYMVTLTTFDKHSECSDTYKIVYHISSDCSHLYIPTAFSPNGDGNNDVFFLLGSAKELQMTIFDRWGREICHFSSLNDKWDGKNAPEGVYNYVLEAICEDGNRIKRGGKVVLIR
jgi:gliding motility-associated-like protein